MRRHVIRVLCALDIAVSEQLNKLYLNHNFLHSPHVSIFSRRSPSMYSLHCYGQWYGLDYAQRLHDFDYLKLSPGDLVRPVMLHNVFSCIVMYFILPRTPRFPFIFNILTIFCHFRSRLLPPQKSPKRTKSIDFAVKRCITGISIK